MLLCPNPHVQTCPAWRKPTSVSFIANYNIKQNGVAILSEQNPGATSSLSEVFSSLVRLRRDGSASVFWQDKIATPIYLNSVKAITQDVGFRSGQLDMWIFSFSTLRPQSDK